MTDIDHELRAAINRITRSLDEAGLVRTSSGNVSCARRTGS